MRFSIVSAIAALAVGAAAVASSSVDVVTEVVTDYVTYCPLSSSSTMSAPLTIVTEVVTAYTTYCPSATVVSYGSETYTVTTASTLTMSGGLYTISRPLMSSTVTICNSCPTSSPSSSSSVASTGLPPSGTTGVAPIFTGGASRAATRAGAGLAAVFGVAAVLL